MKHIVLYSGGVCSSLVAMMVAYQHPSDTVLLHTPTHAEHPDADRFRKDVADFLRLPVTVCEDGRDLWQLITDEHCLPSHFIPFCTRVLKLEQLDKYLKTVSEDFTLYIGYGSDEWRRVQKQWSRFLIKGYKSEYPLFNIGWSGCDARGILTKVGFRLPEPYEHINHNNCLPCFKGGLGHFWSVWKFYPQYFNRAVQAEDEIGHTVFKQASLKELSADWARGNRPRTVADDGIPCLCDV